MLHSTCSLRGQEKSFHCIQHYTISKVIIGEQRYSLLKQQAFAIIRQQRLYLTQQKKALFSCATSASLHWQTFVIIILGAFKKNPWNMIT